MHDIAIVFIYTNKDNITNINLQSIIDNNPGIPVIQVNYRDYGSTINFLGDKPLNRWSVRELWYSCDSIFLYWYLSSSFRAKNYIIVEWDTYCNHTSFQKFLGDKILDNQGIMSAKIIDINSHPNDVWFTDYNNKKLLFSLFSGEHIKKYSPMSCSTISDNCVKDIINYLQQYQLANKLYVETKFTTIANYLGYPIEEYNNKLYNHITYHENTCENLIKTLNASNLNGIFHPIKKYKIYKKYFASTNQSNKNNDIKIHYAIYGSMIDLSQDINFLVQNNITNIHIDNNIAGDPAPFKSKHLLIKYEKDGQIFEKVVNEGENLNI